MNPIRTGTLCLTLVTVLGAGGCAVRGRTTGYIEPVAAVEVTSAPVVDYESYPHTVYENRTVYYVNDRWGYPQRGRWVYYREEPPMLHRYRTRVDVAPPAPRRTVPPAVRVP